MEVLLGAVTSLAGAMVIQETPQEENIGKDISGKKNCMCKEKEA